MAPDFHPDPTLPATPASSNQPELLVSAVLHLMSQYTVNAATEQRNCVKLASVIERHLKALSELPGLAPVLRATCQQLSEQWENVVDHTLPRTRPTLFSRLSGNARLA